MPLSFTCPACGQELSAPDSALGAAGNCRFCGAAIIAPSAPGEPASRAPGGVEAPSAGTQSQAPPPGPYAEGGPPSSSPYVFAPTGRLDAGEIVNEAWRTVTSNWGVYVAAALVAQFLPSVAQQALQFPAMIMGEHEGGQGPAIAATVALLAILQAVIAIAAVPLYYGIAYLTRRFWVQGTLEFTEIFHGYRRFWTFIGIPLLQTLLVLAFGIPFFITIALQIPDSHASQMSTTGIVALIVTGVIFVVGAVYVAINTSLAALDVVDRGCGAVEAVRMSWDATRPHRGSLLGIFLLLGLVQLAGLLACCVGLLITVPMTAVGQLIVYRHLRGITGTPY